MSRLWKRGRVLLRRMADGVEPPFDIAERAFEFALMVVEFVKGLPPGVAEYRIAYQLVKSGTSVGANVEEGYGAESVKDRIHKFGIARKEARESCYWCRLICEAAIGDAEAAAFLADEATQLARILSSLIQKDQRGL
ncbi:MAG: four helix bundle protein [Anaerolineae bacterium]|nr:four helix bundle protein [Anaerolineae bacterium]